MLDPISGPIFYNPIDVTETEDLINEHETIDNKSEKQQTM